MDNYNYGYTDSKTIYVTQNLSKAMRGVYMRMFFGLIVTALTAVFVATQDQLMYAIFSNSIIFWGLVIAEFACVIALSAAINKMSSTTALLLFFGYAILNGVVFSSIFWAYDLGSIGKTFLITAAVFGAMTVYGYTTKSDLTKIGSFLFMALIGVIIASVVNMFLHSSTLEWIVSLAGVAIFIGLTAWDTQKIKQMMLMSGDNDSISKIATLGALSLYLDFINLFLYLLRFFGSSRD